jgi:hypothetical protein
MVVAMVAISPNTASIALLKTSDGEVATAGATATNISNANDTTLRLMILFLLKFIVFTTITLIDDGIAFQIKLSLV